MCSRDEMELELETVSLRFFMWGIVMTSSFLKKRETKSILIRYCMKGGIYFEETI